MDSAIEAVFGKQDVHSMARWLCDYFNDEGQIASITLAIISTRLARIGWDLDSPWESVLSETSGYQTNIYTADILRNLVTRGLYLEVLRFASRLSVPEGVPFRLAYCEPMFLLSDAYCGLGRYEEAMDVLETVRGKYGLPPRTRLKIALRRSLCQRRTHSHMDLSIIERKSHLVDAVSIIGRLNKSEQQELLSELLAILYKIKERRSIPFFATSMLPITAFQQMLQSGVLRDDWRFGILRRLLGDTVGDMGPPTSLQMDHRYTNPSAGILKFMKGFQDWARRNTKLGLTGPSLNQPASYIPKQVVRQFFDEAANLVGLEEFLPEDKRHQEMNIIRKVCCQVTCILLAIGKPSFLRYFISERTLHDAKLPFFNKPKTFPSEDGLLWNEFYQMQWKFCAPLTPDAIFSHEYTSLRSMPELPPDCILPFSKEGFLGAGACATVEKVRVHSIDSDKSQVVSLKIFRTPKSKIVFEAELEAFRGSLGNDIGVLECFGAFSIGQTCCLLLEYADLGNLESYMRHNVPPTSSTDVILLWEHALQLGNAVKEIHKTRGINATSSTFRQVFPIKILVVWG